MTLDEIIDQQIEAHRRQLDRAIRADEGWPLIDETIRAVCKNVIAAAYAGAQEAQEGALRWEKRVKLLEARIECAARILRGE